MSSCIVDANGNYYLLIDNNLYIVHDSNRERSDPVWLESDVKQIAANEFGFFSLINTELYIEVGRRRKLFRSNVLNFGTTNSGLFIITVNMIYISMCLNCTQGSINTRLIQFSLPRMWFGPNLITIVYFM